MPESKEPKVKTAICFACGKKLRGSEISREHFHPKASGGGGLPTVPMCKELNVALGCKGMEQKQSLIRNALVVVGDGECFATFIAGGLGSSGVAQVNRKYIPLISDIRKKVDPATASSVLKMLTKGKAPREVRFHLCHPNAVAKMKKEVRLKRTLLDRVFSEHGVTAPWLEIAAKNASDKKSAKTTKPQQKATETIVDNRQPMSAEAACAMILLMGSHPNASATSCQRQHLETLVRSAISRMRNVTKVDMDWVTFFDRHADIAESRVGFTSLSDVAKNAKDGWIRIETNFAIRILDPDAPLPFQVEKSL